MHFFLRKIFDSVRLFSNDICNVAIEEMPFTKQKFEDSAIRVEYVPIYANAPTATSREISLEETCDHSPTSETPEPKRPRSSSSDNFEEDRMPTFKDFARQRSCDHLTVAYICCIKPRPGRMNLEMCKSLGLYPGPKLGQLKAGKSVTLENGQCIAPQQVLDAPERPAYFSVVECPSKEFLQSLVQSEAFNCFKNDEKQFLDLLVHFSKSTVFQTPAYQEWMKSFGAKTQHLIFNSKAPYLPHSEAVFHYHSQLRKVCPEEFFPPLECHENQKKQFFEFEKSAGNSVFARPYLKFHLRPEKGLEMSKNFQLQIQPEKSAIFEKPILLEDDPEILFFGTSAAVPSKYRNLSGIGLILNDKGTVLLDCGEGTYSQLFNLLGPQSADNFLTNLRLIFISHLHLDHHLGLFALIRRRQEALARFRRSRKCFLIASSPLFNMHDTYEELIENFHSNIVRIDVENEDANLLTTSLKAVATHCGSGKVILAKVDHPLKAYGLILITKVGQKIVYSGDTRPAEELIRLGKGADLLIHEATFENSLQDEAVKKGHSTIAEAVHVGKRMKAKLTVLTHFSARYPKLPPITEEIGQGNVGLAFDNFRFRLSQAERLNGLIPHLEMAFGSDLADKDTE